MANRLVLCLIMLLWAPAACDDGEGDADGDVDDDIDADGDNDDDSGADADGEYDFNPQNACSNDEDMAELSTNNIQEASDNCVSCALDPQLFTCMHTCIDEQMALSRDCVTCFANGFVCANEHCLVECLPDPNGDPCVECRRANCDTPFEECAGFAADELPLP